MQDFLSSAAKYGFGVVAMVIMAVAGWRFFVGHLWPRMLKQVDDAQQRIDTQTKAFVEELKQQRETFVHALEMQRALHEHTSDEQRQALETIVRDIAQKLDVRRPRK